MPANILEKWGGRVEVPTVATPSGFDVLDLAQFGFAAVAAAALWLFIKDLIPRLLAIIDQNATAIERMAIVSEAIQRQQELNVSTMASVAERLTRLEDQHRYGVRECPLMKDMIGEAKK